jgi:polyferredoxin
MKSAVQALALPVLLPSKPLYRWLLALFMIIVISAGWKYPLLGFAVPAAMLIGMGGGPLRGRYACGNICPRGSFYDTVFSHIGGNHPVPGLLLSPLFRWSVMAVLMSFMTWRIAQNPGDWRHWGTVFWSMCLITTAIGIPLGMMYRSRSWCSFCPVGTTAAALGGHKYQLQIADDCRQCGSCEVQCPMGFSIAEHRADGSLPHHDCIKCSSCVTACKREALSWPA